MTTDPDSNLHNGVCESTTVWTRVRRWRPLLAAESGCQNGGGCAGEERLKVDCGRQRNCGFMRALVGGIKWGCGACGFAVEGGEEVCVWRFGRIRRRRWLVGDARVCDGGRRNERWWSGRMDLIGSEEGWYRWVVVVGGEWSWLEDGTQNDDARFEKWRTEANQFRKGIVEFFSLLSYASVISFLSQLYLSFSPSITDWFVNHRWRITECLRFCYCCCVLYDFWKKTLFVFRLFLILGFEEK